MRIFITFSGLVRAVIWLFVLGVVFGMLFAVTGPRWGGVTCRFTRSSTCWRNGSPCQLC